jgi:hypothetical protein
MAVNYIIECIGRDPIPEYYHGLQSSEVNNTSPNLVESVQGRSKMTLPHVPLQMHAEESDPTVLTSNIHIG